MKFAEARDWTLRVFDFSAIACHLGDVQGYAPKAHWSAQAIPAESRKSDKVILDRTYYAQLVTDIRTTFRRSLVAASVQACAFCSGPEVPLMLLGRVPLFQPGSLKDAFCSLEAWLFPPK